MKSTEIPGRKGDGSKCEKEKNRMYWSLLSCFIVSVTLRVLHDSFSVYDFKSPTLSFTDWSSPYFVLEFRMFLQDITQTYKSFSY